MRLLADTFRKGRTDCKSRASNGFFEGDLSPIFDHPAGKYRGPAHPWRTRLPAWAAVALGLLHDRKALDPLLEALQNDWAWNVQAAAAFALGELDEEEAIPVLEKVAKTCDEEEVRDQATKALKKLKKRSGLFGISGSQKNPKR